MKIQEAYWEKRNLGVDTTEVFLDANDFKNKAEVLERLDQNYREHYVVLKLPVGNLDMLHGLQSIGFFFMESLFTLNINLSDYTLADKYKNLASQFLPVVVDKCDWVNILPKLENMYDTDRVYLDPSIANSVSSERYKNWIIDLGSKDNALMYEIICQKRQVAVGYGVSLLNDDKSDWYSLLTGLYAEFKGQGLGGLVIHSPAVLAQKRGFETLTTAVSSNNMPALKKHFSFGFNLLTQQYVLRRLPL